MMNGIGQVVMEIGNINSGKIIIQGDQLTSGIYFFRLTNDKNEVASGKLIKAQQVTK